MGKEQGEGDHEARLRALDGLARAHIAPTMRPGEEVALELRASEDGAVEIEAHSMGGEDAGR